MIKPYYQDSHVTTYNGHVLDVLKEMPQDSMQQEEIFTYGSEREFYSTGLDRYLKETEKQMPLLREAIQSENATNNRPCNSI